MSERRAKLQRRNQRIREEFDQMVRIKHLQSEYACEQLGKKYYLSSYTVYLIIKKIGPYKDDDQPSNQTRMFD